MSLHGFTFYPKALIQMNEAEGEVKPRPDLRFRRAVGQVHRLLIVLNRGR
jgi:hypothetical protein